MKFAAWTKNKEALKEASSGGVFYELAEYFISNGGFVCGVVMEGLELNYHFTANLDTVKKMHGSKYLWANPINMYKLITNNSDVPVLFVGLPCQVAACKRYLKLKGVTNKNVTYVSLRCHGVIKTKIFKDYIAWIEQITKRHVTNVKFRSKVDGWKGAGLGFSYDGGNNFKFTVFFRPKLIKDYIKQRNVAKMCKTCTYDRNASDITLGDFWGCHPALRNRYGTSVIETNNGKDTYYLNKLLTSYIGILYRKIYLTFS